jgi:hypothetical protein
MIKYPIKFGILFIPQTIMNPTIKVLISRNMCNFILSLSQIYEKYLNKKTTSLQGCIFHPHLTNY